MRPLQHPYILAGAQRLGLAASLVMCVMVPVVAQETSPAAVSQSAQGQRQTPAIISDADGRTYIGTIGGLDGWTIPGSDAVFFTAPDGRTTIAGYAFAPDGTDVGAQYSGKEAAQLDKILQRQADIEGNKAVEGGDEGALSAVVSPAAPAAASAIQPAPSVTPEETEEARKLVEELIAGIRDAKTPEEYRKVWADWLAKMPQKDAAAVQETVGQLPKGAQLGSAATTADTLAALAAPAPASSAQPPATPPATTPPPALAPTSTSNQVAPTPTLAPAQAQPVAATQPTPESVLSELRTQTFWFQVGNNAAPTVYAVIDPECPHCARAMLNLKGRVETGKIKLRVALAPIISERSRGSVAAIVNDKEPPVKFWEHEIDKAYGQSKLVPVTDFSKLSKAGQYALQATDNNVQFLVRNDIRGVPFFAWNEGDSAKVLLGVPREDAFDNAIADGYDGNNLSTN